jgi:Phage protein Gp19/Gp15/Gp42
MAYATLSDVAVKWRPLSAADSDKVTALLAEATALLDAKIPTLAAAVTAATISPVLARMVVTDAVIRVLANPAGVTAQTLGPESVQFSGVRTLGSLAFTDDELALLTPPAVDDGQISVDGCAVGAAALGAPLQHIWVDQALGVRRPPRWC